VIATAAHTPDSPPAGAERFRVALTADVGGELRFLSHHDELRLLTRAIIRAGWPVAYSRGFNPQPQLRVPLPRSVGTAASGQLILVDLETPRSVQALADSLAAALPVDYRLQNVVAPVPRTTPHAQRVTVAVTLSLEDAERARQQLPELLGRATLCVERRTDQRGATTTIDIRPFIEDIQLDGRELRLHLRVQQQRSARPTEILTELGLAAEAYLHRLRRVDVQWDMAFDGPETRPAPNERKPLGRQDSKEEGHDQEEGLKEKDT
jgi:radical SAM-linked protein